MSGELQIVFIYDTFKCRKEEDDPKDAILYFHPEDIAEDRRIAICGQLMGLTHFFIDTFSPPKILTLENGKFALRNFGSQYVMALGCSSITPDWLLDKQADILYNLTRFFHRDIQSIDQKVDKNPTALCNKLEEMMDHYIPVSQQNGDLFALTFGILPIVNLPQSANSISLQASVLLQTCSLKKGVLGGIVMYQNKVVGVELSQDLAQKLAFIQPYQLPPAERISIDFKLPPGIQLLRVYVSSEELRKLRSTSNAFQCSSTPNGKLNSPIHHQKEFSPRHGGNVAIDSIREEDPSDVSSSTGFSEQTESEEESRTPGTSSISLSSSENLPLANDEKNSRRESFFSANNGSRLPCNHVNILKEMKVDPEKRLVQSLESLSFNNNEEKKVERCQSVSDPMYPFTRCDGLCISNFYIDSALGSHGQSPNFNDSEEIRIPKVELKSKSGSPSPLPKLNLDLKDGKRSSIISKTDKKIDTRPKSINFSEKPNKRPMNLPLNNNEFPLVSLKQQRTRRRWSTFEDMMSPVTDLPISIFPEISRKFSVDSEAIAQKSSNYKHFNTFRKLPNQDELSGDLSSSESDRSFSVPKSKKLGKIIYSPIKESPPKLPDVLEEAALFIHSVGSMRLLLFFDLQQQEYLNECLMNSLWELGSSSLWDLERGVMGVEEGNMGAGQNEPYCYLRYESVWKSLSTGGRNANLDFDLVQLMHRDFSSTPSLAELIIRGEDHVVYGYQCVGSEIYYQQSAGLQPGLPMPTDLMGKAPLKAKRRLDRDHNIILL